jgi:hypothetical protein
MNKEEKAELASSIIGKDKPGKKLKLSHVGIDKADNGYTVRHHLSKSGDQYSPGGEESTNVFQDADKAVGHVANLLKKHK